MRKKRRRWRKRLVREDAGEPSLVRGPIRVPDGGRMSRAPAWLIEHRGQPKTCVPDSRRPMQNGDVESYLATYFHSKEDETP
jgi:hypothetical protein